MLSFSPRLTAEDLARLRTDYGLSLSDPSDVGTFIERLTPGEVALLSEDPLFRGAVPLPAREKISRDLDLEFPPAVPAQFTVTLDDEALSARMPETARILAVYDDTNLGGRRRLLIEAESFTDLLRIAASRNVRWIEAAPEIELRNGASGAFAQSGLTNSTPLWDHRLTGHGQRIGVIDELPDLNHCYFRNAAATGPGRSRSKVLGFEFPQARSPTNGHGTRVCGTLAGDDVDNLGTDANRGVAFDAQLVAGDVRALMKIGVNPPAASLLDLLDAINGADVHNMSWGYSKPVFYSIYAQDFDTFLWNNEDDFIAVASSQKNFGATGPAPLGSPEDAKNLLAVNASADPASGAVYCLGAAGPTSDRRRKPEIFAPGCYVDSAKIATPCETDSDHGTSFATPVITGLAALVRQYFVEGFYPGGSPGGAMHTPTGALIKAMLLNGTADMQGMNVDGYPGDTEGWGIVRLDDSLYFDGEPSPRRLWMDDVRHAAGLTTGDSRCYQLEVGDGSLPLRITLVWMDPPPAENAKNKLVDDLDLVVTAPGGAAVFLGNVFAGGESATGGAADALNNVEMVIRNAPGAGTWKIEVQGTNVRVPLPRLAQGFAIVATGGLAAQPVSPCP